jgi:hypothetical protein
MEFSLVLVYVILQSSAGMLAQCAYYKRVSVLHDITSLQEFTRELKNFTGYCTKRTRECNCCNATVGMTVTVYQVLLRFREVSKCPSVFLA